MSEAAADDPGGMWRRVARLGALLCTVATFMPLPGGGTLWSRWGDMLAMIRSPAPIAFGAIRIPQWMIGLVLIFWHAAIVSGPLFTICCGTGATERGRRGLPLCAAGLLFLVYAIIPPMVLLKQIPQPATNAGPAATALLSACGLYVMLAGLAFLLSWDRRREPTLIFWLGAGPLLFFLLRWIILLFITLTRGYPWTYIVLGVAEIGGCALLILGWINWWRAVAGKNSPAA